MRGAHGRNRLGAVPTSRTAAALFLIVAGGVGPGCASHSKTGAANAALHPVVLRMESQFGEQRPLDLYAREVSQLSHGSIKIVIGINAHRADPHAETKVFADVRSGRAPLGWVGSRVLDRLGDRRFQALTAPMLIDNYTLQQRALSSVMVKPMLASMERLGVVGVGVLPGPLRRLLGVTTDLVRPADFRGRVIAYADSDVARESLAALGALPRLSGPMAPLGTADGTEAQLNAIYGNRYFRGASSVTANLALWPRPLVIFMNRKAFSELSATQRNVMRRAASASIPAFTNYARSDDRSGASGLCTAGVRFTSADLPSFRRAFAPVYAALSRNTATRGDIERLLAMKATTSEPAGVHCPASAKNATTAPAVLDGVYRKSLTPAQAHSATAENWGTFVRVFDHGRFALTQESPKACTWDVGSYTVHGQKIHFVVQEAGGIAPNNAGGKPGETVDLDWRLYRGALALPSPPGAGPVEWGDYRKLTPTPSSRYFSRRCPPPAGWDG
jgi:TRAP-type C4-dicarboxylate transport system substrate-binding protein